MSTNELHSTIKELKEYKLLKEEAEARISELESIIKMQMAERNVDTLIVDEYKCKLTTVNTNKFDSKALQSALPNIYQQYIKASSYQRFTVN